MWFCEVIKRWLWGCSEIIFGFSLPLFFKRTRIKWGSVWVKKGVAGGLVGTKFKGYSKVTMRIKKDLTLSKTDDARSSFFLFAWDFRGCQTLPFLRGQTMPRFPKNRIYHRVNSFIFKRANPRILSPSLHFSLNCSLFQVL